MGNYFDWILASARMTAFFAQLSAIQRIVYNDSCKHDSSYPVVMQEGFKTLFRLPVSDQVLVI